MRTLVAMLIVATFAAPFVHAATDEVYKESVWFQWGKATLDVWIVPPTHGQLVNGNGALGGTDARELNPLDSSYTRATLNSVDTWNRAITAYGSPWLKSGLTIHVALIGRDVPRTAPTPAEAYPDVVITFDENKGPILGVAVAPNGAQPCIVDNSRMLITSFTYEDMFNINSQEYGHCLGLNHVDNNKPTNDPMNGSYPYSPGARGNPLNCVSNLDVAALDGVFARALAQPSSTWGASAEVTSSAYQQISC